MGEGEGGAGVKRENAERDGIKSEDVKPETERVCAGPLSTALPPR